MGLKPVFEKVDNPDTRKGSLYCEVGGASYSYHQSTLRLHTNYLPLSLKLPRAGQSSADISIHNAGVTE